MSGIVSENVRESATPETRRGGVLIIERTTISERRDERAVSPIVATRVARTTARPSFFRGLRIEITTTCPPTL